MTDTDLRPLPADGPLPWWAGLTTRRLAVGLGSTLLALPFLALDLRSASAGSDEAVEVVAAPTTAGPATTASPPTTAATTLPPPSTTTITLATTAPAPPAG
ncbi:MAG: hypothetical protein H0W25_00300, partial [Acidimicrobiia bacterium]|nr:hypothetical protein [Acidimicrobiia bacterium]